MSDVIARDEAHRRALLHRWPGSPLPAGSQLVVQLDDAAVFLHAGRAVGTLGPGTWTLDVSQVPFLGTIAAGDALGCELHFVTTRRLPGFRVGGPVGSLLDPASQTAVNPRFHGEVAAQVRDPARLVADLAGAGDEAFAALVSQAALVTVRAELPRHVEACGSLLDAISPKRFPELGARVVEASRAAGGAVAIVGFGELAVTLGEDERRRLLEAARASTQARQAAGAPAPTGGIAAGSRVLVAWTDGRVYPASVRRFERGYYEVTWEGGTTAAWVPEAHVRPGGA